jgi:hypothetical protein
MWAKVNLAPFGIGGWGKRASSGFLTPMVFQVTTRGGQVGRYIRESKLSRTWGASALSSPSRTMEA